MKELLQYGYYNEDWLTFDQLTMVPIQRKLIERSLLTNDEVFCSIFIEQIQENYSIQIDYLNEYHLKVRQVIGEKLKEENGDPSLIEWLERNTQPI